MSIFRAPEVATRHGALDDEAFVDGADGRAGIAREMIRDANAQVGREHLVFRWQARARVVGEVGEGQGLSSAPPSWQALLPLLPEGMPVPKKHGLERLRVRIRAEIDDGRDVDLHLATSLSQAPTQGTGPTTVLRGTGAIERYDVEGVPCRRGLGEELALFARGRVNVDSDDLLDTGTYGGVASGTVSSAPTLYSIRVTGAGWNATGDRVHLGGHYLITRDASGAVLHGPAEIRAVGPDTGGGTTDELYFDPPAVQQMHLVGQTVEIRKLPQIRVVSVAIYTEDR